MLVRRISMLVAFEKLFNTQLLTSSYARVIFMPFTQFCRVCGMNHDATGAAEILRKCIRFVRL